MKQAWQWVVHHEDGRKICHRERPFFSGKPPRPLLDRIKGLRFTHDEEKDTTLGDVLTRTWLALGIAPEQKLFARFPNFAKRSDELAIAMLEGKADAFNRFCEFHLRLAKRASFMLRRWFEMDEEDASQIAFIGLMQAAGHHDPKRGNSFLRLQASGSEPVANDTFSTQLIRFDSQSILFGVCIGCSL